MEYEREEYENYEEMPWVKYLFTFVICALAIFIFGSLSTQKTEILETGKSVATIQEFKPAYFSVYMKAEDGESFELSTKNSCENNDSYYFKEKMKMNVSYTLYSYSSFFDLRHSTKKVFNLNADDFLCGDDVQKS